MIGNLAVALMNVLSWQHNDAKISGSRKRIWIDVGQAQWDALYESNQQGGIDVPMPGDPARQGASHLRVYDTGEVSAQAILVQRAEQILLLAGQFFLKDLQSSPGASGVSKKVEMLLTTAPALGDSAANIQAGIRDAIRNIEQLWLAKEPKADFKLPTEFSIGIEIGIPFPADSRKLLGVPLDGTMVV